MPSRKKKQLERPPCCCPAELKKICKAKRTSARESVSDIIAALTVEQKVDEILEKHKEQLLGPHKKKKRDNACPRSRPRGVCKLSNIQPPMDLRLRYIRHCDDRPYKPSCGSCIDPTADYISKTMLNTAPVEKKYVRRVCDFQIDEPNKTDIIFPNDTWPPKHIDSKEELKLPSPKVSGEIISAQRAQVKTSKPPVPGKSAHELFKPHSGVVLNPDQDYAPLYPVLPRTTAADQKKEKSCARGGICNNPKCKRKKCRDSRCWSVRYALAAKRRRKRRKSCGDGDDDCGLNDVEHIEHPDIPHDLKRGTYKTLSLTTMTCKKVGGTDVNFGIMMASSNMYGEAFAGKSKGRQALCMSVMAYCLAFHYHPREWNTKLMNTLLEAGNAWYLELLDKQHDHSAFQGICEVMPYGKKQVILLNNKRMLVLLGEPEVIGYAMSLDPTVYNLCRGLKAFFSVCENRACVLMSRMLKVTIWRDKVCYYIFDPAGRDNRAYQNFATGAAAIITVKDLKSVAEILLTRSVLEDQRFVLAPLKVLRMVPETADEDLESEPELTQAEKAQMSYRILNETLAIANANIHLGDIIFEDSKFRQALPIAVAALTYSKISPPNTWYSKTLDKIMRLGNQLYKECAQKNVVVDLTIDNIPDRVTLGPYMCDIIIYRDRTKGQLFTPKACVLNIKTGLADFFEHDYNSGILDFSNYKLAVWRQKDMYYLFDPYPRTKEGDRSVKAGKGCCFMLLNTHAIAEQIVKNWNFLPPSTPFTIHAFKVLKLKKKETQSLEISPSCNLDFQASKSRVKRKVSRKLLPESKPTRSDMSLSSTRIVEIMSTQTIPSTKKKSNKDIEEEKMGDIVSLVDSIQEDDVPPVKKKYKNLPPVEPEPKIASLDSPTVSVTQMIPPWPKPRDKTNEPPDPDPDREPTPPPTPPPPIPPEGAEEAEAEEEEELDEEQMKLKREEELRRKMEEEEARRRAERLPPPLPPPPPTPQVEPEPQLTDLILGETDADEMAMLQLAGDDAAEIIELNRPPPPVKRRILPPSDQKKREKMKRASKAMLSTPLVQDVSRTPSQELLQPHNFTELPDGTEIIRGTVCIPEQEAAQQMPFASIMAVVVSNKYLINTWTRGLVDYITTSGKQLHALKSNSKEPNYAPMYIIPNITIGHQTYKVEVEVCRDGPTWQLEEVLTRYYLPARDRGIITTPCYSAAFFRHNGLYYLYDPSCCNGLGVRVPADSKTKGQCCLMRFKKLHNLVCRVLANKGGRLDEQQFLVSYIAVRTHMTIPRYKLPDDFNYAEMKADAKTKVVIYEDKAAADKKSEGIKVEPDLCLEGYQCYNGVCRVAGSTALPDPSASHFVCLVAMLMATMRPIRKWNPVLVDICIEKGLEIHKKAASTEPCEKRVIKNVIIGGKILNVNIKNILVINENKCRTLEQYVRAVLARLRYVIIEIPKNINLVIVQSGGLYHLFDPLPPPDDPPIPEPGEEPKQKKKDKPEEKLKSATWTLYPSMDSLLNRLNTYSKDPDCLFYTFELTSIRTPTHKSALAYMLSRDFIPKQNPNLPFLQRPPPRPLVNEKLYWVNNESVPWSRVLATNDLGMRRGIPQTKWKEWDIELKGDLYSLWGTMHPRDNRFNEEHRGKQYLACCMVSLAIVDVCHLAAWTSNLIDGIIVAGDKYHEQVASKIGGKANYEIECEDFDGLQGEFGYITFTPKSTNVIFGFVYNIVPNRFNLSQSLAFFFEKHSRGILISPMKNLAFGKIENSYFMFDCQSHSGPIFCAGLGYAYILKCETLNRLIHVITVTLNARGHNQQFHLFSVEMKVVEQDKVKDNKK